MPFSVIHVNLRYNWSSSQTTNVSTKPARHQIFFRLKKVFFSLVWCECWTLAQNIVSFGLKTLRLDYKSHPGQKSNRSDHVAADQTPSVPLSAESQTTLRHTVCVNFRSITWAPAGSQSPLSSSWVQSESSSASPLCWCGWGGQLCRPMPEYGVQPPRRLMLH